MTRGSSPHDDRRRRVRTTNAVWTPGPGQWALGAYKICQQITDTIPEDQEAVWEDADHIRFCIRPQPVIPATFDENAQVTPQFHTRGVGIYQIGRGVLVKFKHMGMGGSSREPEAMKLIQKEAPSVPVPEVFHHWKDPEWFCYVTIMREIPGREIGMVWFALDESQKQRLAEEAADHFRAIAEIQSETAQYANGENLCDGLIVSSTDSIYLDEWAEPEQGSLRFNFKQLNEYRQSKRWPLLPEGYGDRFHLCYMDANPDHFFVSDGVTTLPDEYVYSMPLEEQAKLHISVIIDFERSGFFPKFIVSWQFQGLFRHGLANHEYGKPDSAASEFDHAVIKALIKLGFPDPGPISAY
ncbi:hypothetical protein MMC28_007719 [Mycoblastus sanguinarius]|nr:hypothetical protein [Mycoblastus sanguinarius]